MPGRLKVSGASVAGGTKKSKNQDMDLLCHQYVVRSRTTNYTIRHAKPAEQHLTPINTAIQFTLGNSGSDSDRSSTASLTRLSDKL